MSTHLDAVRRIHMLTKPEALAVVRRFAEGDPPSWIDADEGFRRGTTHDLVVASWADHNPKRRDGGRMDDD